MINGFIKKVCKQKQFGQWSLIAVISLIVATINIAHVILGQAKTPPGYTYMATGHYYLDYFVYLQAIAQGAGGRWLPVNYLAADDNAVYLRSFPYIILGKIAWVFRLSPMAIYWLAVFFLSFLLLIGFYLLIVKLIPEENFYVKVLAFFLAVSAAPLYFVEKVNNKLQLIPYDFWYGPSNFIRRFGVVPYHLLASCLVLAAILILTSLKEKINNRPVKGVVIKAALVAVILLILLTFSPFSVIGLLPTIILISCYWIITDNKNKDLYFLFNLIILAAVVPVALVLKKSYGTVDLVKRISELESGWQEKVPWWFLLLNLGPMVGALPLGLKDYLSSANPLRKILVIFVLISYGLFISPIASYLGTHNLRFFSSLNYPFFAVVAILGLKRISHWLKIKEKIVVIILSLLLIGYSWVFNVTTLKNRIEDSDPYTPEVNITYVQNSIVSGLKSLAKNKKNDVVLTDPYSNIGLLVPVFSFKRVYVGRPIETPNFEKKQIIANSFYSREMTEKEAKKFLEKNNLGFVVLTLMEGYFPDKLISYPFLKEIYKNESIIIFKVDQS